MTHTNGSPDLSPQFADRPVARLVAIVAISVSLASVGLSARGARVVDPPPTAVVAPEPPAEARSVGTVFPSAPDVLMLDVDPAPTIDGIRAHLEAGDAERALRMAERAVAAWPASRDRDAAWMVIGVVHSERGAYARASDAFGEVRAGKGPLASLAAYLQAEQEHLRGNPAGAVALCRGSANAPHAADCLRIEASAHAAMGHVAEARAAATTYDAAHPTGPISEQIELALAEHLVDADPEAAIPIYAALAVHHGAALTGRVAEERLAELAATGHPSAKIPDDLESREQRALSLREAGRRDAAWEAFDGLRSAPAAAQWVKDETERFGWQTQRWSYLEQEYVAEYARTGDPEIAWKRYRVLARAGRFDEAASLGVEMQNKAGNSGHWRKSEDEIGRTMLLAKRYPEARAQFDVVVGRGGWSGRRAAFSAAFAAYMAGELDDAVRRFDSIVTGDPAHEPEARYWRAKALDRLGRAADAAADRSWLTTEEPWSWYAALVAQANPDRPEIEPYARAGRWVGTDPPADPGPVVLNLPVTETGAPPALGAPVPVQVRDAAPGFAGWTADGLVTEILSTPSDPFEPPPPPSWELEPPSSYRPSALHVPERSRAALAAFADEYGSKWPELRTTVDLASVGLYDLSGPMFNDWYERWRDAVRKRDKVAKKLVALSPEAWRDLFLAARDHNNTARNLWGVWETLTDPAEITDAWRLAYPLAHDRYVWSHAREHDLDPYLVLGLMRQESTYNATARSRVGARGAMQIMPRTGHLLADLQHDTSFDAGDLEDPTVAVGYGIRYLGLLLDRFDGVFPLAVASYNAGPFNVSNWLQGVRANPADPSHPVPVPIDEFVEHIPFRETRDYVKKVTEGYSAYIALYTPAGSALIVPPEVTADRREVVDF